MKNFWKNKKVLITGHTGFKGSWMTLILSNLVARIYSYASNPISKPNFFDGLKLSSFLKKDIRNDILNLKRLTKSINKIKPEIIFHMAAQSSVLESYKDPIGTTKANILGTANILEAFKHAIEFYKKKGEIYDNFVALGACSPLRAVKDINNCIKIFNKKKAQAVISVKEIEKPVDWILIKNNKDKLRHFIKKSNFQNRQSHKKYYIPNGSIYVFDYKRLIKNVNQKKDYLSNLTYGYIMPKNRSVDIDDFDDLMVANYYFSKK